MPPFVREPADRRPFSVPLFPLRTVLFPGGVLPLKIFEQRYIDMAKDCLRDERPFGVCLITRGEEVATPNAQPPEFATIGTLATIASWEMPQLGILHVATTGGLRFKVQQHAVAPSGLVGGEVTTLVAEAVVALPEKHAPLAKLLQVIAARIGPQNFPAEPRYDDASWVGYRLAELLPLPLSIKQSMLEINDAGVRLDVLSQFLAKQGLL
ncbi:MAG: LON peptidase substrate-binding domain-containing protein [Betaproteobacteria bacterium]